MRDKITDNRLFIMGLAILWVALYHIPNHTSIPIFRFLQDIGYGGVDIFVFISGFGVYMSLKKDSDAGSFLGRRLKRLLPSYMPFIILWMIVRYVTYQLYLTEVCGNLTMTGWWNGSGNQFNWYVDGILIFYILAPYIYGIINKTDSKQVSVFVAIGLMAVALLISLSFLHGQLLMAMSRLPLFVLGMLVASNKDGVSRFLNGKAMWATWTIVSLLGFAVMYYFLYVQDRFDKWHYGLWWYPFILIVPGLVWNLGIVGDALKKLNLGEKFASFVGELGKASFEIFLWHLFIFETAQAKWIEGNAVWIGLFLAAFIVGYAYYKIVNIVSGKFKIVLKKEV